LFLHKVQLAAKLLAAKVPSNSLPLVPYSFNASGVFYASLGVSASETYWCENAERM